jgi:hypothetical protein
MRIDVLMTAVQWQTAQLHIQKQGGLTVPVGGVSVPQFAAVELAIQVSDQPLAPALPLLRGQAVQVFGDQLAVMLDDLSRATALAPASPPSPSSSEPSPEPLPARATEHVAAETAEDEPVWKRLDSLSKIEMIRLAKTGNHAERRWILKQRDASLHLHVLTNPALTPLEVAQVIRANAVQLNFVQRVLERNDLCNNPTVAESLVLNPLTPIPHAVRLVAAIPLDVARRISKSTDLRQAIVAAARKRSLAGR